MMIPLATLKPGDGKASCLVQPPQDEKMVRNPFDDGSVHELVVVTINRSVIHLADETGAHQIVVEARSCRLRSLTPHSVPRHHVLRSSYYSGYPAFHFHNPCHGHCCTGCSHTTPLSHRLERQLHSPHPQA